MLNVIIAFITGILSSMGFGGGTLLMIYLTQLGGYDIINAIGINYIYYIPCALISVIMYIKSKLISVKPSLFLAVGAVIGSLLGAVISSRLDNDIIKNIFASFIVAIGIKDLFF